MFIAIMVKKNGWFARLNRFVFSSFFLTIKGKHHLVIKVSLSSYWPMS